MFTSGFYKTKKKWELLQADWDQIVFLSSQKNYHCSRILSIVVEDGGTGNKLVTSSTKMFASQQSRGIFYIAFILSHSPSSTIQGKLTVYFSSISWHAHGCKIFDKEFHDILDSKQAYYRLSGFLSGWKICWKSKEIFSSISKITNEREYL